MAKAFSDSPLVRVVNRLFVGLMDVPLLGGLVRRGLIVIRYEGRKSGKTFELPVGYRRSGDDVIIGVGMPDKKNWWRNFLGEGAPLVFVGLDGADRIAHAVATRDAKGGVSVKAQLA